MVVNLIAYPTLKYKVLDPTKVENKSFMEGMSAYGRSFFKFTEDYTLTTGWVERKNEGEYLDIPEGYAVYITDVYVAVNGNTDSVYLQLRKNSKEAGAGVSADIFPQFIRVLGAGPGLYNHFDLPLPIRYDADEARSIIMAIKGSGTTNSATCGFRGYILRREY